jgi:hypothetical protein
MPLYTVLAPPPPSASVEADPLDYVFVKDGICWPCLVSPELWMVFRRLWLVLVLYLLAGMIVLAVWQVMEVPLAGLFLVMAHLYFALEANALRVWTLTRHGYRMIGIAEGRRVGEAEIRFFHDREMSRRDPRLPPPARMQAAIGGGTTRGPSAEAGEVVGLFPAPGRVQ